MKNFFVIRILCVSGLTLFFNNCFADLSCPLPSQIKQATLTSAKQNPYDSENWEFFAEPFLHQGKNWQVEFGTFLSEAQTPAQALRLGLVYFAAADIVIDHPEAVAIPGGVICEYVPPGRAYWISAFSSQAALFHPPIKKGGISTTQ